MSEVHPDIGELLEGEKVVQAASLAHFKKKLIDNCNDSDLAKLTFMVESEFNVNVKQQNPKKDPYCLRMQMSLCYRMKSGSNWM